MHRKHPRSWSEENDTPTKRGNWASAKRVFLETYVSIVRYLKRNCGRCNRATCRTSFFFSSPFLEGIVYLVAGCFPPPTSCFSSRQTLANRAAGNRSIREIFNVFRAEARGCTEGIGHGTSFPCRLIDRRNHRARFRCRCGRYVNINSSLDIALFLSRLPARSKVNAFRFDSTVQVPRVRLI